MEPSATDLPTANEMMINPQQIIQMTEELFGTMLNMEIVSAADLPESLPVESVEASVKIGGQWAAELRVLGPKKLAESTASAMFDMEPNELTPDETHDAWGEIANIIGGNIKGIVDRDCDLSLPEVKECGGDWPEHPCIGSFHCCNNPLRVILIQH